jgi:hypothetical protein
MRVQGLALIVASVMALGVGCGNLITGEPEDHGHGSPWATGTPPASPTPTATPEALPSSAATNTAADTRRGRKSFATGIATYCTRFFSAQSKAEDTYPVSDLASQVAFVRASAKAAHRSTRMLVGLTPPSDMADPYEDFVANAHDLIEARRASVETLMNTGNEGAPGEAVSHAVVERRTLAKQLHAKGCDGQLPPGQRAAVIDAVKRFETTTDSTAACRDLTTPAYLMTRWPHMADPLAGCIASRDADSRSGPGPPQELRQIKVQTVTGSDGIGATVYYTGACRCTDGGVARLHLVDGSWLITETNH